jgi:hypothetical protein
VDVAELIWAELRRPESWSATLGGRAPGVTLAPVDGDMPVHPLATITGRQRIAPLDTSISRMGARRPRAGTRAYRLDVTAPAGVAIEPAIELFPAAQFTDTLDAEAVLRAPAVSPRPGGVTVAAAFALTVPTGLAVQSDLDVETVDVLALDEIAEPG